MAAVLALLMSATALAGGEERPGWQFVTRRGDQIMEGDRPFRFISFNIPNLLVIEDAYEFTRPNPWRWPDEFEIEDALESVRQMGGQVVRTYVISVRRDGSDMGDFVHVRAPGEFNEEGFRALDRLIEVARRKGIRVILPLVDQHKWWGGIGEYAGFRGRPAEAFWTDQQIKEDFKATIRYLITRKNVFTGVAYRDEPAIFGWETGNELDSTPEWTREIAAYIKELDSNHLVIDGRSLHGVPLTSLDDPNVDVITTHHYPWGDDHDFTRPIRAAHAQTKGKKPYFVGEFGFVETPHIAAAIQAVIDDGISGALLWSLRMHRREGGFYWHMEVGTGKNIYKAFHWPGFASGDRYDERVVMRLMREKAHEIRGIGPPPLDRPRPPQLLPIEGVSAISWQGSAGAESYNVWRTEKENGRWAVIAKDVSDAEVQYRPLYNDHKVEPGKRYWYRVSARNTSGESAASNVVGPVAADCRTLVDECRDVTFLDAIEGGIAVATENARTVQEDCHRFAMRPGAAVTYRVPRPIHNVRIFSFARDEDAQLQVSISADGQAFQPLDTKQTKFDAGQTVYGYLTPVLIEANVGGRGTYLKISMSPRRRTEAANDESNDSDQPAVPAEISRVEIEYDRMGDGEDTSDVRSSGKATPVNGSIFVESTQPVADTLVVIDKAAERGERRLSVCVTLHVDLSDDLRIKAFGGIDRSSGRYRPFDEPMHKQLQEELRQIFARMHRHNMGIVILPHIDSGGRVRTWRNWVDFDPVVVYGGYSYKQLIIDSIADALVETVGPEARVALALSGEMGTSLFRYPESYREIIRQLRERDHLPQLKIGVSLNHHGISGQGNPNGADDITLNDDERAVVQQLINECDFVGMSFYRPVSLPPTPADFVHGIEHFMNEFHEHGLVVPTSKPLHFSEVGIGGGYDEMDAAIDPARAVETPWSGSGNPRVNPWQNAAMQQLRRDYHVALLQFLTEQPARWHVSAAFFWGTGSWDPIGMRHPEFADEEIAKAVRTQNLAAESEP
ncbi:MAG TPA: cellulase family glycosylhydrolase [Lacipirellulaceae bacterium]|nr:cellulase family glycosylhydrolase [Lacipirellulaceae bacterium]